MISAEQMFPALDGTTAAALRSSIERFGVLVPVVKDQNGRILDGHHRAQMAEAFGIPYETSVREVADDEEAAEIARTLNMDRRHLDPEQRREVVAALRGEGHSIRAIAGAVGVDPKTVRKDLGGEDQSPPDYVRGKDGKLYPATMPKPGETITDDSGQERLIADVEDAGEEVIFHDDQGDALIVGKDRFNLEKPDLGDGISHPARYSLDLIPVFADLLEGCKTVLDPFAGTGRIHELELRDLGFSTMGVEIEPEWAFAAHGLGVGVADAEEWANGSWDPGPVPITLIGNALALPFADNEFDAICTSPTYGNRLADHHDAADPEQRRSYTHDLGRPLHNDNSGSLQWGDRYRAFHREAWIEALRVLRPGGTFVLNIKDHIRGGVWQDVTAWHVSTLIELGLQPPFAVRPVAIRAARSGSNSELRVGAELVIGLRKGG